MDEKKSTRRQMDDMSRELRELQDENTELKVKPSRTRSADFGGFGGFGKA